MAIREFIANPLSRLTADPVLRAFFDRSAPPLAPAYVVSAPKPTRLTGGESRPLPRLAEFA